MNKYASTSGKQSGVTGYETGDDFISVRFQDNTVYKYTCNSAGSEHIESMKQLAKAQNGLSTYISQHDPIYAERSGFGK
jgi:hypothetical protein